MAPLRDTTSTRAARLESSSLPPGSARRHRFDGETEILGSEYGQPFLAEYLKTVVPEVRKDFKLSIAAMLTCIPSFIACQIPASLDRLNPVHLL
jgi:hypothetical protein